MEKEAKVISRPQIKDFFGDVTLEYIHEKYSKKPELYNFIQALDQCIDQVEKERDGLLKGNINNMDDSFRAYVERLESERDVNQKSSDYWYDKNKKLLKQLQALKDGIKDILECNTNDYWREELRRLLPSNP